MDEWLFCNALAPMVLNKDSKNHVYFPLDGQFICSDQNPLVLAYYLYSNSKSLLLHTGNDRYGIISKLKGFILYKLHQRRYDKTIRLPAFGNLCLPVHRGYKVFDFRRKRVIKVLNSEVSLELIDKEVEAVREASRLDFAPQFHGYDHTERWYAEEFINGRPYFSKRSGELSPYMQIFPNYTAMCLIKMISFQKPILRDLHGYVHLVHAAIRDRIDQIDLSDKPDLEEADTFISSITQKLYGVEESEIDLVFSHGDFSMVNILRTHAGMKVIDWESANLRSSLFDFYNYFITELYYNRAQEENLVSEMKEAISTLNGLLVRRSRDHAAHIVKSVTVCRWLYYIERIKLLLDRDFSSNLATVILRSMQVFLKFENRAISQWGSAEK